ncbi:MAG: LLM class flavin-dependent oxidoreductase [Rhizobiales bacterium]|nr:LLM class flavin-dependent oxidoreductase [Hyphomicrobiales bacterium]MBI3672682.1 LLM class flavin-dependent oxidoreductase [Hyphomicrobiales bacterium]
MEIGLHTFADVAPGGDAGLRLRNLIEEMELADKVGLDVFGVGEHHRRDYSVSAPAVALAAGAARTKRIRLTSAVTVLGSDDPVRVFEEFSILDGLSNGRAEIMAGRGSFIESFPLFGYDLDDYDALFAEKLDLLLKLREGERITWQGKLRAPLDNAGVYPRPVQNPLPVWIAVGGTPQSVVRAATLGLPMALAIIGGDPARFAPYFQLYREAAAKAGRDPKTLPLSLNMHGFVAATGQQAKDTFYGPQAEVMTRIGRERGWGPQTRDHFEAACGPDGNLVIGSPDEVAEKIVALHRLFGNDRILIQMAIGTMPHDKVLAAIDLMGSKVAPMVRAAIA